jgi:hypothetical protein
LECLAQFAAAEGRLGHPLEQIGKTMGVLEIKRFQGLQTIVAAVVQSSGHDSTLGENGSMLHFRELHVDCQGGHALPPTVFVVQCGSYLGTKVRQADHDHGYMVPAPDQQVMSGWKA